MLGSIASRRGRVRSRRASGRAKGHGGGRPTTGRPKVIRGFVATLSVLLLGLLFVGMSAVPASAATCSGAGDVTMTIDLASGEAVTVSLSGAEDPRVIDVAPNDPSCAGFDTATVATIQVNGADGDESVTIDQAGSAPFPHQSTVSIGLALGAGTDALVIVGQSTADAIGLGTNGISLDAGGTPDVTGVDTAESVAIRAGGGDDVVSGKEGGGLGDGFATTLTVDGEEGNDALTGGDGNDAVGGGSGNDTLKGGAGGDTVDGGDGDDVVSGGAASDVVSGGGGGDASRAAPTPTRGRRRRSGHADRRGRTRHGQRRRGQRPSRGRRGRRPHQGGERQGPALRAARGGLLPRRPRPRLDHRLRARAPVGQVGVRGGLRLSRVGSGEHQDGVRDVPLAARPRAGSRPRRPRPSRRSLRRRGSGRRPRRGR